jgi:hypothetical protein
MHQRPIHRCQCSICKRAQPDPDPEQELHFQINLLMSRLDEQQRRWFAALESMRIGHGGDRFISQITGLHVATIRRGRTELAASLKDRPIDRVRLRGAGRPTIDKIC